MTTRVARLRVHAENMGQGQVQMEFLDEDGVVVGSVSFGSDAGTVTIDLSSYTTLGSPPDSPREPTLS